MPASLTCKVCGNAATDDRFAPTFKGDIVSHDFPAAAPFWAAHGGYVPLCGRCHDLHRLGMIRTYDTRHLPPGVHGVALVRGAGI